MFLSKYLLLILKFDSWSMEYEDTLQLKSDLKDMIDDVDDVGLLYYVLSIFEEMGYNYKHAHGSRDYTFEVKYIVSCEHYEDFFEEE